MLFAMNYSPQAAELLRMGHIQMDRFKTPDWPWMIAEALPLRSVAVHFGLKAAHHSVEAVDWDRVETLLDQTGTPFVNLHLEASNREYPQFNTEVQNDSQRAKIIKGMLKDVNTAVRRFGAERVIIENVPYRGASGRVLRTAVEPEVIQGIVAETGCGLLLDISHARIAAHHLGMDAHAYIEALPVKFLRELHFTGLHSTDGQLQDHLPALPEDWPHLQWALDCIRGGSWSHPWMLVFEYGGVGEKFTWRSDPAAMREQAPRLYAMVKHI